MNKPLLIFPLIAILCMTSVLLHTRCSSGGGTEGGNTICGVMVNSDNTASINATVLLIPSGYNPGVPDSGAPVSATTTTRDGRYLFNHAIAGDYSIEAVDSANGTRTLITGIVVSGNDVELPVDTLREPGAILVIVPAGGDTLNGYAYVPGTTICSPLSGTKEYMVITNVPAVRLPSVCYASPSHPLSAVILQHDVQVMSNDTVIVANALWKYSRRIVLNTSATGANTVTDVTAFPVLIRLNRTNFIFSEAHADGADLRFAKEDSTPLFHEIERWNSSTEEAEIWVRVDTVYANNTTQSITMYWGNPLASDSSRSVMVFDTATGFQGVWHMHQPGNTPAVDATANHFDGIPVGMDDTSSVLGMVGNAQRFNGSTSHFSLQGTASGTLNFPQNGFYSLSAWVYTDVLDSTGHYILSKGDRSYNLNLSGFNLWEVYDIVNGSGLQSIYTDPHVKVWKHLVGVRNGKEMRLYVDGTCMDSTMVVKTGVVRNDGYDVQIGKRAEQEYGYWNGMLDEVCIMNVAVSADWIKLCYMNQRKDNQLVMFE